MLLNNLNIGDEIYVRDNMNFDVTGFGWTRVHTYDYDPRGPGSVPQSDLKGHIVIQNEATGGGRINKEFFFETSTPEKMLKFQEAVLAALLESPMIANSKRGDLGACKHHAVISLVKEGGFRLEIDVNVQRYSYDFKQNVKSSIALLILKVMEEHDIRQYDARRRFY